MGGAAWGSGSGGVGGAAAAANSIVGTTTDEQVGGGVAGSGVYALSNGSYVVRSPIWNGNRGAATWGSGSGGVSGPVSAANSLVGSTANDQVGSGGVTALSNGNYVVSSSSWNG